MDPLTDVTPPKDAIRLQLPNTSADVGGQDLGNGILYIAESAVVWQRESDGRGLQILYPCINCHAVSRDLHFFPHECLHLMVENQVQAAGQGDAAEEEGPSVMDIRFIPLDKSQLLPMYTAMAQCQALHPDPVHDGGDDSMFEDFDEAEEEEGETEFYRDGEEGAANLSSSGQAMLQRLDVMMANTTAQEDPSDGVSNDESSGQFQDADME